MMACNQYIRYAIHKNKTKMTVTVRLKIIECLWFVYALFAAQVSTHGNRSKRYMTGTRERGRLCGQLQDQQPTSSQRNGNSPPRLSTSATIAWPQPSRSSDGLVLRTERSARATLLRMPILKAGDGKTTLARQHFVAPRK